MFFFFPFKPQLAFSNHGVSVLGENVQVRQEKRENYYVIQWPLCVELSATGGEGVLGVTVVSAISG